MGAAPRRVGKWVGGRVREARGRLVWVIERQRRVVALDVASEREALAELALWERAPDEYRTRRQAAAENAPVVIDEETLAGLMRHFTEKGLSQDYKRDVRNYLAAWGDALGRRDLRKVQLRELRKLLSQWGTARKSRIEVAPVSWSSTRCAKRVPRCRSHVPHTRRSSVSGSSSC